MNTPKKRLNLTIDEGIKNKAMKTADEKHIPVSRLVENFLEFFTEPYVYCFQCGEKFSSGKARLCAKCGWLTCPKCESCRCGLSEDAAVAVFHMRRVYEDLLAGRVKV